MSFDVVPGTLSWDEADPDRHPFDHEEAARIVRSLGPARRVPARPDGHAADPRVNRWSHEEGSRWADAMSFALAERYGRWAVGWRWAHDEGDFDGGPVGSWCCPRDSITTPEETVDRVVAALCEWRGWLEDLADRFEAHPLDPSRIGEQRILWECAARHLVLRVVDRTGCGSGWYGHCRQVLTWFLERWGVPGETAAAWVDEAIGGRFRSWTGPDVPLVHDVAERIASALPADGIPERPLRSPADHLAEWLAVREAVAWQEVPDPEGGGTATPVTDGPAEDFRAFDGALDPARAEGLLAALDLLREDAARGARLDFDLLRGWQRRVLGVPEPPAFRDRPAFAKDGRERYGLAPDARARLDACLAQSDRGAGAPLSLPARAARAYLDVCFFHPFDDGNARAALLALLFVLARENVALDSVLLLRRWSVRADAPEDARQLAGFVAFHIRYSRERAGA
ncbi:Fic family protein [Streptomyces sp. NPDC058757]|uniref:Fic family protein n=1 Tax=Streptomyces sp. NPDC058757 TaxID=3346626 RepID=UPI0036775BCF